MIKPQPTTGNSARAWSYFEIEWCYSFCPIVRDVLAGDVRSIYAVAALTNRVPPPPPPRMIQVAGRIASTCCLLPIENPVSRMLCLMQEAEADRDREVRAAKVSRIAGAASSANVANRPGSVQHSWPSKQGPGQGLGFSELGGHKKSSTGRSSAEGPGGKKKMVIKLKKKG